MENMEFKPEVILERTSDNLFVDIDTGKVVKEIKLFSVLSKKTLYYNTSNDPLFNDLDDIRRIVLNYTFKCVKLEDNNGDIGICSDMIWYLQF